MQHTLHDPSRMSKERIIAGNKVLNKMSTARINTGYSIKRSNRKISDEALIDLYVNKKYPINKIARELNVSSASVSVRVKKLGLNKGKRLEVGYYD